MQSAVKVRKCDLDPIMCGSFEKGRNPFLLVKSITAIIHFVGTSHCASVSVRFGLWKPCCVLAEVSWET